MLIEALREDEWLLSVILEELYANKFIIETDQGTILIKTGMEGPRIRIGNILMLICDTKEAKINQQVKRSNIEQDSFLENHTAVSLPLLQF